MDISLNPVENLDITLDTGNSIDISLIPANEMLDYEIDHVEELETNLETTESLDVDMKSAININVGGSIVVPNPPEEPTDNLETVMIDYDTFKIKDPDIYGWARQETKPNYTPPEVGAVDRENELTNEQINHLVNAVFGI